MGVACPQLSDEPSYTMVESSGGSCRCTCQEDFHQDEQEQASGCCSPHVFTSILLGILSCVLMTGGVFLAFHRWDPMWLMVSGVGVVLILIGTVLHCCNNMSQRPKRHSSSKGCCRPAPPDHHVIPNNNGSLTEQLLPLSNARSVSQLSLNMLPGYFPPVVTAYGIEQHSAVVQNINRLVQQQQQQQPQSPAGSCSPGVSSTAGKSFIVLSLPGDTSAANIQNLVATVYQLDGNTTEPSANEINANGQPTPVTIVKPNSPVPLVLKNAEVQTCCIWPATVAATTSAASTSGENSVVPRSSSTDDNTVQAPNQPSATTGATQTEDILPVVSEPINLMDCSSDISPICDNPVNACDSQSTDNTNNALVDIPPSQDLLDVSTSTVTDCTSSVLVDIPEPPVENLNATATTSSLLLDVVVDTTPNVHSGVLVDISSDSNVDGSSNNILLDGIINSNGDPTQEGASATHASTSDTLIELPQRVPESTNSNLQTLNPELLSSVGNLSAADTEIDDGELMERSSPPPSYEDVTLEVENIGAFGLAYGTI